MSDRKARLELIRERHQTLILANRAKIQFESVDEEWEDSSETVEEEIYSRYGIDDDCDE